MLRDLQIYAGPQLARPRTKRKSVFVVTENLSTWRALGEALDSRGYLLKRFAAAAAFLAEDHPFRTGCIVIDAAPDGALSLLEQIKPVSSRLSAIILAESIDIRLAVTATRAGAFDVLQKPIDRIQIESCVHDALETLRILVEANNDAAPAMAAVWTNAAFDSLTTRQVEILGLVVQGRSNKDIANHLGISLRTAENHRAAAMRKLGVSSISELVRAAAIITPFQRLPLSF